MVQLKDVTPGGIHLSFPTGVGIFSGPRLAHFIWWWSAIAKKDLGPRCGCGTCHCHFFTLNQWHDCRDGCYKSFKGSKSDEEFDMVTSAMRKAATSKDFGTIRVYFRGVLLLDNCTPGWLVTRKSPNPKLILQTLHDVLQESILNDDDIMEPELVVQQLVSRFREVWPEEWKVAETLWKEHINLLWGNLRKRLRLVHLFNKARVRANDRLYRPGAAGGYQECMERFQTMQQQKFSCCEESSSSLESESSNDHKYSTDKKRKRDDDDDYDDEIRFFNLPSVKQRKIYSIGNSSLLVPTKPLATHSPFRTWQLENFPKWCGNCTCPLKLSKKIKSYNKPSFRAS